VPDLDINGHNIPEQEWMSVQRFVTRLSYSHTSLVLMSGLSISDGNTSYLFHASLYKTYSIIIIIIIIIIAPWP
jgi:hypothetical protein